MDDTHFDELVKALATPVNRQRLIRLLTAATASGAAGVAVLAGTGPTVARKGKQKGRVHGKGKRKGKNARGEAKSACPGGRCDRDASRCRTEETGCACVGTGNRSRCELPTTTTTAPTTTTTTAAPPAGQCAPGQDVCQTGIGTAPCGPGGTCNCWRTTSGGTFCGGTTPFGVNPCVVCTSDTECDAVTGPGSACVTLAFANDDCSCDPLSVNACVPPCEPAATMAGAGSGGQPSTEAETGIAETGRGMARQDAGDKRSSGAPLCALLAPDRSSPPPTRT